MATKRAATESDLERIRLDMVAREDGVEIVAEKPDNLRNVSVDLEIVAPPDAAPPIMVGVGQVDYRGGPRGDCRIGVGVGSAEATLLGSVDIEVKLSVGVGSITVGGELDHVTSVGPNHVEGRIGTGEDGLLEIHSGVGSISLLGA